MYRFLLAILLLISSVVYSQDSPGLSRNDTPATIKTLNNAQKTLDSLNNDATFGQMQRNMISFLNYQKEQKAKQRRKSMLYIGIGLAFLALLVIGLRRRVKK